MANEIQVAYTPSLTLHGIAYNASGQRWNGTAFVDASTIADGAWATGGVTFAESLTDDGTHTGEYLNSSDLPADTASVSVFVGSLTPGQNAVAMWSAGGSGGDITLTATASLLTLYAAVGFHVTQDGNFPADPGAILTYQGHVGAGFRLGMPAGPAWWNQGGGDYGVDFFLVYDGTQGQVCVGGSPSDGGTVYAADTPGLAGLIGHYGGQYELDLNFLSTYGNTAAVVAAAVAPLALAASLSDGTVELNEAYDPAKTAAQENTLSAGITSIEGAVASAITAAVTTITSSIAGIAAAVWSFASRTLSFSTSLPPGPPPVPKLLVLVRGDDYAADTATAPIFFDPGTWPDLSGATIVLTVRENDIDTDPPALVMTGSRIATGPQKLRFTAARSLTSTLRPSHNGAPDKRFDVRATLADSGEIVTLVYGGSCVVYENISGTR